MKPETMWAWLDRGGYIVSVHHKRKGAISECIRSLRPTVHGRFNDDRAALWRECQRRGHTVVKVDVSLHTVSQGPFSEYGS